MNVVVIVLTQHTHPPLPPPPVFSLLDAVVAQQQREGAGGGEEEELRRRRSEILYQSAKLGTRRREGRKGEGKRLWKENACTGHLRKHQTSPLTRSLCVNGQDTSLCLQVLLPSLPCLNKKLSHPLTPRELPRQNFKKSQSHKVT